jgi:hypothetical protein
MPHEFKLIIKKAYDAFNRRSIDEVLSLMDTNVHWPNGWEGGYVDGHEEVRDYWTRQWREIDPSVSPLSITLLDNGCVEVLVQQLVKDVAGKILYDGLMKHVYTFKDDLITSMEIRDADQ